VRQDEEGFLYFIGRRDEMIKSSGHARDHIKFDHWPIDRHWNKVGHGLAADVAYRMLFQPGTSGQRACLAGKRAWN
jgi:hypothetical protein